MDGGVDDGCGADGLGLVAAILGVSLVIGTLQGPNTGCLYCGGGEIEARRAWELFILSGLVAVTLVSSTFSAACTVLTTSRGFSFKFQE